MCSFIWRETSELVGRRYDYRHFDMITLGNCCSNVWFQPQLFSSVNSDECFALKMLPELGQISPQQFTDFLMSSNVFLKTENKFKKRMKKIDQKRQVFCYQKEQVLIEKARKQILGLMFFKGLCLVVFYSVYVRVTMREGGYCLGSLYTRQKINLRKGAFINL